MTTFYRVGFAEAFCIADLIVTEINRFNKNTD